MSIPERLLRPLTLLTPVTTTDAYGAAVPGSWTSTAITGRTKQLSRSEATNAGRHGEVSEWLLLTNCATVAASDRVVDGGITFEVVGPPWPDYGASGVHHYKATLRLVEG